MRPSRFLVLLPFVALSVAACPKLLETPPESQTLEAQSRATATAGAMTVYVSDFDLDVVQRKPSPKPAPRTSPPSRTGSVSRSPSGVPRTGTAASTSGSSSQGSDSSDTSTEETPAEQASALVRAVSENIIRALMEAGYDVRRLPAGAPLPQTGLRIRGVFAEADEQNRARRLLVGGEPVGTNIIILYVGVNNLKTREQPLYELASPPAPDPRHGPVITVTSYAPAERFELSRDPSADELKSVATKVAADLTALVSANRLSLTQ